MVCAGEYEYCHLAYVSGLSVEPNNCGLGAVLLFLGLPSYSGASSFTLASSTVIQLNSPREFGLQDVI